MIKNTLHKYILGLVVATSLFVGGFSSASALTIETLLVAGGGSGSGSIGGCQAGAGGAGGYLASSTMVISAGDYPVTVGNGGSPKGTPNYGNLGGDSTFNGLTAVGGGFGGSPPNTGGSGGSGVSCGGTNAAVAGTAGQGNSSGATDANQPGGGGGAGSAGTRGNLGGAGGSGVANSISGSSVTYAVGGNGNGAGANGTANRGNGGAGNFSASGSGGTGGSGIFIARCLTSAVSCTGGTVTTDGLYTVVTFTTSGTLTIAQATTPSNSKKYSGFFKFFRFR